ncbi:MAG: carboxypeptidase regulatory-like domain-containing protein [Planctomycetota bacterium]
MNCSEAQLCAIRLVDGELPASTEGEFQAHIETCADCREFLAAERATAKDANRCGEELRASAPSLETLVLQGVDGAPAGRPRQVYFAIGMAAVLMVVTMLAISMRQDDLAKRRETEVTGTRLVALEGAPLRMLGDGEYEPAAEGKTRIEVSGRAVVLAGTGRVELTTGVYRIHVDANNIEVHVEKGSARITGVDGMKLELQAGSNAKLRRRKRETKVPFLGEMPVLGQVFAQPRNVTGVVVDDKGRAVEGAQLFGYAKVDGSGGTLLAKTDTHGRFVAEFKGGSVRFLGAIAQDWAPTQLRELDPAKTSADLRLGFVAPGSLLKGTVTDAVGKPVAAARIEVGVLRTGVEGRSEEGLRLHPAPPRRLVADKDGRFYAVGLPTEWQPLKAQAKGYAPYHARIRLPPLGSSTMLAKLTRGSVVKGTVCDASGNAVAGVRVTWTQPEFSGLLAPAGTVSDANGRFKLEHVPAGRVAFHVVGKGTVVRVGVEGAVTGVSWGDTVHWAEVKPNAETVVNPVLPAPLFLSGRVVLKSGAPAAGFQLALVPMDRAASGKALETKTDATGAFRLDGLSPNKYWLRAWYPNHEGAAPHCEFEIKPRAEPYEFVVPDEGPKPASVQGVVTSADGPVVAARVRLWSAAVSQLIYERRTDKKGAFVVKPLTPGRYQIEVHVDGRPTLHLARLDLAPGASQRLSLRFPEPARLELTARFAEGTPEKLRTIRLVKDDRVLLETQRRKDGVYVSEALAAGEYRLAVLGLTGFGRKIKFAEGETVAMVLPIPRPVALTLRFRYPGGEPAKWLVYGVEAGPDTAPARGTARDVTSHILLNVVPGVYKVQVTDDLGRRVEREIVVHPDPAKQEIEVDVE